MEIYIYDDLQAEDSAMLQALYSRSSDSVTKHIEKVKETGSGKFMEKFYVGYGHKSIGQCGSTTIFFENVSLLAAKAIQDSQLYNGQECSTRYLDFKNKGCYDPVNTKQSQKIINTWMSFYEKCLSILQEHLKSVYPKSNDIKESEYQRAINARCFDVARGFLPTGLKTNLSFHTTLAHAADKLTELKFHPLKEVQTLATNTLQKLNEKYPNSFKYVYNEEQENYIQKYSSLFSYDMNVTNDETKIVYKIDCDGVDTFFKKYITNRPKGMMIPKRFKLMGDIRFMFNIDFGSFRDFQRHRSVHISMPLVKGDIGFADWYIEQFPKSFQSEIISLITDQFIAIENLKESSISKEELQYFYPLGTEVKIFCVADLPSLVYILELRTQKTVHPTLRYQMQDIANQIQKKFPHIPMYIDYDQEDFTLKRASQTIIEK